MPHTRDENGKPTSWIVTADGLAEIGRFDAGWKARDAVLVGCTAPVTP